MDRDGDNSRSKEYGKLAYLSQARFLVNAKEALGLTPKETLDSSLALIEVMMQEYAYLQGERNRMWKEKPEEPEEPENEEYVMLPDFETGEMRKVKKKKTF